AAVLLLVVVLATQVLGGGSDEPDRAAQPTDTGNTIVPPEDTTTAATPPAVDPADTQVFVLNGTTQNGIAAEFAKTLETAGYVSAGTGNAPVSTVQATEVFYAEGKKRGATAVARELGVKSTDVKQADANVTALAQGADVIVQIGADKATP
ncbi:MAG: LytR C-terminal domain-containing protein, partial [Solirubrobacterales bacterium]|nr:LytR C-terminal domain-containing protein [Solirubrobacterales bacterium]